MEPIEKQIQDYITEKGRAKIASIQSDLSLSYGQVRPAIDKLVERGLLCLGEGSYYELTELAKRVPGAMNARSVSTLEEIFNKVKQQHLAEAKAYPDEDDDDLDSVDLDSVDLDDLDSDPLGEVTPDKDEDGDPSEEEETEDGEDDDDLDSVIEMPDDDILDEIFKQSEEEEDEEEEAEEEEDEVERIDDENDENDDSDDNEGGEGDQPRLASVYRGKSPLEELAHCFSVEETPVCDLVTLYEGGPVFRIFFDGDGIVIEDHGAAIGKLKSISYSERVLLAAEEIALSCGVIIREDTLRRVTDIEDVVPALMRMYEAYVRIIHLFDDAPTFIEDAVFELISALIREEKLCNKADMLARIRSLAETAEEDDGKICKAAQEMLEKMSDAQFKAVVEMYSE